MVEVTTATTQDLPPCEEPPSQCRDFYVLSFDLETTGLCVHSDCVAELGMTLAKFSFDTNGKLDVETLHSYQQYCKPGKKMGQVASDVTGLTDEFLDKFDCFNVIVTGLAEHIDRHCENVNIPRILTGYNIIRYDLPLLFNEILRYDHAQETSSKFIRKMKIAACMDMLPFCRKWADTTKLKRNKRGLPSYRLGDVFSALTSRDLEGAHGAIADAKAVEDIMRFFPEQILQQFITATTSGTETQHCCTNIAQDFKRYQQMFKKSNNITKRVLTIDTMFSNFNKKQKVGVVVQPQVID